MIFLKEENCSGKLIDRTIRQHSVPMNHRCLPWKRVFRKRRKKKKKKRKKKRKIKKKKNISLILIIFSFCGDIYMFTRTYAMRLRNRRWLTTRRFSKRRRSLHTWLISHYLNFVFDVISHLLSKNCLSQKNIHLRPIKNGKSWWKDEQNIFRRTDKLRTIFAVVQLHP